MLWDPEIISYTQWFDLSEKCSSCIALLKFTAVPILLIVGGDVLYEVHRGNL